MEPATTDEKGSNQTPTVTPEITQKRKLTYDMLKKLPRK